MGEIETGDVGLGQRIDRAIRASGHTRTWVAAEVGVSLTQLSNYVGGRQMPKADRLLRIAEACGVPITDLYGQTLSEPSLTLSGELPGYADLTPAHKRAVRDLVEAYASQDRAAREEEEIRRLGRAAGEPAAAIEEGLHVGTRTAPESEEEPEVPQRRRRTGRRRA